MSQLGQSKSAIAEFMRRKRKENVGNHIVTGDEGHHSAVVMEMEARGAKVVPIFAGK